jgi:myo-inositol-1(or 4)-monophosphatase
LPEADLALLERAARAAGELARGRAAAPGRVVEKPGGHGPVSDTDIAVDRMLRAELAAARPDYGWLSEESEDGPERLAAARVFVVDPIDGTRAFLAGDKAWALALAVVEAGEPVAGVVHLPALGLSYAAARGAGARLNGAPIAAGRRTEPAGARVLASASQLAPAHWPGGAPAVERLFRPSLAYRLCLVAEGRADAAVTFRDTWEWDVAAGAVILAEAGAKITDRTGRPHRFNAPSPVLPGLIAAGAPLHARLLELARPR